MYPVIALWWTVRLLLMNITLKTRERACFPRKRTAGALSCLLARGESVPGLKQGLGVQEVGAEATPGVPSTAWADGDHPETEQVHQDVTQLSQVGRVSEAAHLGFVKWQMVFLARGACPGRFLGGGGLPLRGDFSEIHLAGLSSASPTGKQRSKLRRGQSWQGHSLSHTAGTLEGLAAKHTSEKCDCHRRCICEKVCTFLQACLSF